MSDIKLELPYDKKPDDEDDPEFDIHSQMDDLYGLLNHQINGSVPERKVETSSEVEEALMEQTISLETEKLEDESSYPSGIEIQQIPITDEKLDISSDSISTKEPVPYAEPEPEPKIPIIRDSAEPVSIQKPTVVRKRVIKHGAEGGANLIEIVENLMESGYLAKAEFMMKKSFDKNRDNPKMNVMMGKILFESGRIQESQRYFDRALTLNNLDPEPWVYLGRISLSSDPPNKNEAAVFLKQAKKIDPYNPLIDDFLSQCH